MRVNEDGFGDVNNIGAVHLSVFNDHLYVGTRNDLTGGQLWRSSDGITWNQVGISGFGDVNNREIYPLAVFGGYLYAGTLNFIPGSQFLISSGGTGGQLWRSSDGTTWEQVDKDGFGDVNNVRIIPWLVFEGYLYVGTLNYITGSEVWRSSDGITWEQVNEDGFGNNSAIYPSAVFGGYLYAGTLRTGDGRSPGGAGGQLWRSPDGTTWMQVNEDGFGDVNNIRITPLLVFGHHLYAGTHNAQTGGQLWRSSDGTTWEQVGKDGFGDVNNKEIFPLAVFGRYLYTGTWNEQTGGEVWRIR
jgi:hypothetical protein